MAIILGIDPGSRVTGYGVIRQVGRQLSYLGSGCIRTKVDDLPSRLKLIYAGVTEIITQVPARLFLPLSRSSYGQECRLGVKARAGARGGDRRSDQSGRCRCLNTPPVSSSRPWSGLAAPKRARSSIWCAPCFQAARQSAGGCGGCAGDCHHPLPCQPECRLQISETRLNLARGRLR